MPDNIFMVQGGRLINGADGKKSPAEQVAEAPAAAPHKMS